MLRSLRTRLVAAYVFAAIVLVLLVTVGISAFALSMFGLTVRESVDSVARAAPDEVRLELARHHNSLAEAAPDIVRHLVRPSLHVAVVAVGKDGVRRLLARAEADEGRPEIVVGRDLPQAGGRTAVFRIDRRVPRPGSATIRPPDMPRAPAFPLGLTGLLHLEPRLVQIDGGFINIFPLPVQLDRFIRSFLIAMLPIGLVVVGAAWLAGRFITNQALRPLVETTASLNRFAAGDFTPREIVTTDRSEIGELVTAYNGAAAQVASAFEERRAVEREMRQFVADAGHELRTPLTVVIGFIDVLRRRSSADPGTTTRIFDMMLAESRRMRALIDKLISLARLENPLGPEISPVDVGDVAEQVVAALQALQSKPRIELAAEHGVIVNADEYELHEAISNLVDNALKYAPLSPVEVRVRTEDGRAVVDVADRGPGLSEEERVRVFDRFYRGENRGDAEGSGLGLAIVKRAVERAGGEVTVDSQGGYGARFTIRLPLTGAADETQIAI
jgi:two-component system OmpR family sensor kinase